MKKSELRKYISEALTPDEASKVEPKYKETYAAMIKGKGPLHLKKYDNPDAVVRGRVVNNLKESTRRTNERLEVAIKEVFSEKQRKYMCVMAQPGAKRPKGLSKADAKEMCADTNISKAKQEEQTLGEIDAIMNEKSGEEIAKKNMNMYKDKNRLTELIKAALMSPINEKKKDHDGDGDIDSDDYMIARDKAIKKAKGKVDEASKAGKLRIPKDIEKLLQDAHGDFVAGKIDGIELGERLDQILNNPQGPDPNAEGYYGPTNFTVDMDLDESFDSLVKKVDKAKGYTKKEAEKVAGAIAAKKMKGAGKGPTAKQKKRMAETILKELRGNINEALNKDLKDVGMDIARYLKKKGLEPKFIQGENLKLYQDFPENGSLLSLMDGGARLEIAVNDNKIDILKEIIKKYNLQSLQSLKQTGGWADDPKKKSQSKGEIYIASEKPQRRGKAFTIELKRFNPSEIK